MQRLYFKFKVLCIGEIDKLFGNKLHIYISIHISIITHILAAVQSLNRDGYACV